MAKVEVKVSTVNYLKNKYSSHNLFFLSSKSMPAQSQLTQQAPESSSWHRGCWHGPPPSSAFFLSSAHNLREAADCTWRTLLHLSQSRQLSAGTHSTSNAHSSCLMLPDATYTWHHIPHTAILSPRGQEVILTIPFL